MKYGGSLCSSRSLSLLQNLYSIMFHVLIFDKSCEKRGTVYLYSLQYHDFILQNLTRKTAEIVFAGIYISKIFRTPLECFAPSALATRPPPQNNHPGYATVKGRNTENYLREFKGPFTRTIFAAMLGAIFSF